MTNNPQLPHKNSPDITAAELWERLQQGEPLFLLDVREVIEYHTYNIGGLNIPLAKLPEQAQELQQQSTGEIIVLCQAGLRSKTAQSILWQNGYQNVRNLSGGLLALRKLQH